jgi:hypothetical protein
MDEKACNAKGFIIFTLIGVPYSPFEGSNPSKGQTNPLDDNFGRFLACQVNEPPEVRLLYQ